MKKLLQSLLTQKRIAGGALVLAITQLVSSGCGFLRDQAFSLMFPIGKDPLGVASVYIAAFRPSDLLFQIFVMSCLSVVLVPFLAAHLAHDRKEEMNRLTTSALFIFSIVFGIVAIVTAAFFRQLAPYLVQFHGESLELYIRFGRIALLTNFLFVFGNTLGQYLITLQRYWLYGITPILWALGTVGGTYLLTPLFGPMGPMYGTVIGTIVYVVIRFLAVTRSGYHLSVGSEGFLHDDLRKVGILIIPRMVAVGSIQLQLLLLDRLASGLGQGVVALNQFASNFESLIPGIVGIAIAQSAFSILSQSSARGDHAMMRKNIRHGILFNLSLAIPSAVLLALLSSVAAWILHLDVHVSGLFQTSLWIYCIAVPFESTNHIVLRSFYAFKNTFWPAVSSIISCTIAVTIGTLLLPTFGMFALAIAYVSAQISQTIFLGTSLTLMLHRKTSVSNKV